MHRLVRQKIGQQVWDLIHRKSGISAKFKYSNRILQQLPFRFIDSGLESRWALWNLFIVKESQMFRSKLLKYFTRLQFIEINRSWRFLYSKLSFVFAGLKLLKLRKVWFKEEVLLYERENFIWIPLTCSLAFLMLFLRSVHEGKAPLYMYLNEKGSTAASLIVFIQIQSWM